MGVEEDLKKETDKWLLRIEGEVKGAKPVGPKGKEFLKNIQAYIKDSGYFARKGDLVRSFECVIWAWAYLSISRELKLLKIKGTK